MSASKTPRDFILEVIGGLKYGIDDEIDREVIYEAMELYAAQQTLKERETWEGMYKEVNHTCDRLRGKLTESEQQNEELRKELDEVKRKAQKLPDDSVFDYETCREANQELRKEVERLKLLKNINLC